MSRPVFNPFLTGKTATCRERILAAAKGDFELLCRSLAIETGRPFPRITVLRALRRRIDALSVPIL